MSDRELLELAAKAAGVDVVEAMLIGGSESAFEGGNFAGLRLESGGVWNALTDDGDALRLVVKLRMAVSVAEASIMVIREPIELYEPIGLDVGKSVRRAIVRAAAEIGKAGAQ
ncbi:hypothetical protein [Ectopseudomonas khazarica]|uniref:hypothetical protein n=1 Tax=Ectopseudomonas khazarica TaxID=2502979 RepID=UPI0037C54D8C